MSSDLQGYILIGILALGTIALGWRVLTRFWRTYCPNITPLGKAATIAALLVAAAIGGDKSPIIKQMNALVTALRNGTLIDPSGRISDAAKVAAIETINATASGIVDASAQVVADAQWEFDEAAYTLTNRNLKVAYIAADLPRALPGVHTNSNVAGVIQSTQQDGATNLLCYVWYSQEPAVVPQVAMSYSVAEGQWDYMPAITNSYPETFDIAGVPCIEYRYEIPALARGTAFRPEYELYFGGNNAEPLIVPSGGLMVQTNGINELPFTGTDVYSDSLSVTYQGGVAVSATYHGTNYTGVVTL